MAGRYIHLNAHDAPARGEQESDADFESRLENYRKNDCRIPVAGLGKVNFGFWRVYDGSGTLNRSVLSRTEGGDFSRV